MVSSSQLRSLSELERFSVLSATQQKNVTEKKLELYSDDCVCLRTSAQPTTYTCWTAAPSGSSFLLQEILLADAGW